MSTKPEIIVQLLDKMLCIVYDTDYGNKCLQVFGNIYHIEFLEQSFTSDVWLTVHRNSVWIRKTN